MTNFNERDLHRELAQHVRDKKYDLREVAKDRIRKYVKTISSLIENNKYDLVISGGNSGLYSTKIVDLIYGTKNIKKPPIFSIPAYRHNKKEEIEVIGKDFDNSSLTSYVEQEIPEELKIEKVLFVDDEIGTGTTAKNVIELVINAKSLSDTIDYTLVAENHFFEWRHNIPSINLKYYAHAKVLPSYNNLIAYIVPRNVYTKIGGILEREVNPHNYSLALITSGLVKNRGNGVPYYDDSKEKILFEEYPEYKVVKEQVNLELKELVERTVNG